MLEAAVEKFRTAVLLYVIHTGRMVSSMVNKGSENMNSLADSLLATDDRKQRRNQ
jgi:hypothetical protein